ncbi:zf-HC2 domain-containing protein [Streptomyces sannanensis]
MTCVHLHEIGAELALGVLPGRERAEAIAHLDGCAACREYVEQLTLVGDGLLGLLPGSEPPVGFETRVARRLTPAPSARQGRTHLRESGRVRERFRGRGRVRVAAAAAAAALAFGFGGWAVGTAIEGGLAPSLPVVAESGLLRADLTAAGPGRLPAGEIYAHPGPPAWVYMYVDLGDAMTPYSGKVTCLLVNRDGSTARVGVFTLRDGYGYWGSPAPVNAHMVSGARLVSSGGTVLATAQFAKG